MFVAVSLWPLCWLLAFHMLVTCWLPDQVQVTFQDLVAELPVLVTVTLAVKPLPQSLPTWYVAVQPEPPPLPAEVIVETAEEGAETLPAASYATTVYEYCVEGVSPVSVNEVDVVVPARVLPR